MKAKQYTNQSTNQHQPNYHPQTRAGDWKCVICCNINFAFRSQCNRCGLISKEQNDHHNTMIAYGGCSYDKQGQTQVLPYFLTPLRKKDKENKMDAGDQEFQSVRDEKLGVEKSASLLSVSPVLRQLGL